MRAVGIVVEYNPFHNGHAIHLKKTKEKAEAEIVIAVMSGQFLQRGEPSLLHKWARTKMALMAGVDIVVELPYQFATQKADTFAEGAISILSAIGCSAICFGSESGDIRQFNETYDFLQKNNKDYQKKVKHYMDQGNNYPTALSLAFQELNPLSSIVDLTKPNNILGFQYLSAVKSQGSSMSVLTITRTNAAYHDEHFSSESIASATSIRKALFSQDGKIKKVRPYIPETTYQILQEYHTQYKQFHQWEHYWPYLKFRLLQTSPKELRSIYEVEEGLENRIMRVALVADSFQDFMNRLKTKRYTWTRLQRMCVHILTNTSKEEMETKMIKASYIRLLGMNERGREYLNRQKGHISLPIVSKASSFQKDDIELDIRASRIYALGATSSARQAVLNMEYTQPPIYLRQS